MPAPAPENLPISLPTRGVDRSMAFAAQPPLSTPNALNVRGVDSGERSRVGKRSGHGRAFTPQAGDPSTRAVLGLFPLSLATGLGGGGTPQTQILTDDFMAYTPAAGPNLLGNWIWLARLTSSASNRNTDLTSRITLNTAPQRLTVVSGFGAEGDSWFLVNYLTTNDITITARAQATAATDQATVYMIGLRGSDNWSNHIRCSLVDTGVNTWAILIERQQGNALTTLGTSANFTIDETAATVQTDLSIRAFATATGITVQVSWPSRPIPGPALSALAVTFTVMNTDFVANARAGFGFKHEGNTATGNVLTAMYGRIVPVTPTVVATINGTDIEAPLTNRYLVPTGFQAFNLTTGNVNTRVVGPSAVVTAPLYPCIDQTSARLYGGSTSGGSLSSPNFGVYPTVNPGTDRWAVEQLQIPVVGVGLNSFSPGIRFRVTVDGGGVERSMLSTSGFLFAGSTGASGVTALADISLVATVLGVNTNLVTATLGFAVPVYIGDWVQWRDTGTNIECWQHGIRVLDINYSAQAAWTSSGASTALATSRVVAGTSLSAGSIAGTSLDSIRFVNLSQTVATAIGNYTTRVLVMTAGKAQHGRLDQPGVLNTATGFGTYNTLPNAMSLNGRWYVVDGAFSKIVDPIANTSLDWNATLGTFPAGCQLVALYRGRAVLARQAANPSIWYMSRTLQPTDWLIASDPKSTSAIAGTDPDIGQPADAITALIPFNDDLLIMGCATSIYMVEGDPGYKGAVQNVTSQIGVVGPRAFCFDEAGNLYFLGPKGLYRCARGNLDPEQVDKGRLPDILDRVNLNTTLVQLVYDKFKATVHIFLTPTDGVSVGVHVVYNTRLDQLWIDQYPIFFGPSAACEIAGVEDRDRRFLMAGADGYVRRPLETAFADDADTGGIVQPIDSWVEIGPFEVAAGDIEAIATEIDAYLSANTTGPVQWYWFVGASPEQIAAQGFGQEVATGLWGVISSLRTGTTGFQPNIGLRQRGGCHKIRIRQVSGTAYWSVERIWARIQARSRRR